MIRFRHFKSQHSNWSQQSRMSLAVDTIFITKRSQQIQDNVSKNVVFSLRDIFGSFELPWELVFVSFFFGIWRHTLQDLLRNKRFSRFSFVALLRGVVDEFVMWVTRGNKCQRSFAKLLMRCFENCSFGASRISVVVFVWPWYCFLFLVFGLCKHIPLGVLDSAGTYHETNC